MAFVNPYSFIPLDEGSAGKKEWSEYYKDEEGLLTGRLDCRLVARNPVIIPDQMDPEKKSYKDKKYDAYPFMTVAGKPMIPGSSLRGVVRSLFEAITDSCVYTNDDYYFSSRTNIAKTAGMLERTKNGWRLLAANRYADKDGFIPESKKTGEKIAFSWYEIRGKLYVSRELQGRQIDGYILKMNPMRTETGYSSHSIFVPTGDTVEETLEEKYIDVFKENLKKYIDGAAKEKAKIYKERFEKTEKEGGMIPVWYEKSEGGYYLAPSQLSRNIYTRKPKDILPEKLKPCIRRESLCPACALFGFVSKTNSGETGAMGSRVRFTDAWATEKNILGEYTLLPILSSPRTSSLEFYLRYGEDFYHADTPGVELSGRKFYWHHSGFNMKALKPDENPKMTSFMQPADAGSEFCFNVYFDRITKGQLDQLYTAITLGENSEDSNLCLKIGHGKPLGFGSVKVIVDKAYKRVYSDDFYKPEVAIPPEELTAVNIPGVIKKAMDYNAAEGLNIDYPRVNGRIFTWFAKNRPPADRGKARFYKKLPLATNRDITLPEDTKS